MSVIQEAVRQVQKYSSTTGVKPTNPSSSDHTDGSWGTTDIYDGELFVNLADGKLFTKNGTSILELNRVDGIDSGVVASNGSNAVKFSISSGTYYIGGKLFSYPTTADAVTISNGDGTHSRYDAIVVNSSGTAEIIAGTASATPEKPTITAGKILVAWVLVPSGHTSASSNITPINRTGDYLQNVDFGANQIVKADTAGNPSYLTIGTGSLIGRNGSGSISSLDASTVRGLLSLNDNYLQLSHTDFTITKGGTYALSIEDENNKGIRVHDDTDSTIIKKDSISTKGLTISNDGITVSDNTPSSTSGKIYNAGGGLYWSGSKIATDTGVAAAYVPLTGGAMTGDLTFGDGDKISATSGSGMLDFRFDLGAGASETIILGFDVLSGECALYVNNIGSYPTAGMQAENSNQQVRVNNTGSSVLHDVKSELYVHGTNTAITAKTTTLTLYSDKTTIAPSSANYGIVVTKIDTSQNVGSFANDSFLFLNTKSSGADADLSNSLILGGIGIQAKASNTAYANNFALKNNGSSYDGILKSVALTADHVWTFPDATGTVVLAPASPQVYTLSNVTTDRALDADSTDLAEVADVLGTLINDLSAQGIINTA